MRPMLRHAVAPALLLLTVLGVLATWVIGVPRFGAPDEPAHMYKAYGTAHGDLRGDPAPGYPDNLREFDVPLSLAPGDLDCVTGDPTIPFACATTPTGQTISSAAPYPPYYYAVVGGGA